VNLFGKSLPVNSDPNSERKQELRLFEKNTGLRFRNYSLLNQACSHRSYSNEHPQNRENNERLEFLGDAVLGLVVSTYLFKVLPDRAEGDLAKIKSIVVSEESLSLIAKELEIDKLLLMGKGEENSGGRAKKALLADGLEAIIGACYLDSDFETAQQFVLRILVPEINKVLEDKHKKDYKTLLQELVQKELRTYPRYNIVSKTGPDHDRTYVMEVVVQNQSMGLGTGKNKKEAEQAAAAVAYERIQQKN